MEEISIFWAPIYHALSATLFKVGQTPITLFSFAQIIIALIIAFLLSKLLRRTLNRLAKQQQIPLNEASLFTLNRLIHYIIITLAIILSLSFIGLDFTNLALIASALGVGIGFGLQSIANNFISGLIILFERNIRIGDYVLLQSGVEGTIKEINVRSTLIKTSDNLDIIVPNAEFISSQVTNWTLHDRLIRVHIPFGVAYGTDKERVKTAITEAALNIEFTYTEGEKHAPLVWLVGLGDSSLNFELVAWVNTKGITRPGAIKATYLWEIESALRKYNIEIPFPQRDLHLKTGFKNNPNIITEE